LSFGNSARERAHAGSTIVHACGLQRGAVVPIYLQARCRRGHPVPFSATLT